MKASQLDKLLDCNCDTCDFKHYRNTEDCDIYRKKAILLALKEMVLSMKKERGYVNSEAERQEKFDNCYIWNKAIDSVAGLFEEGDK